MGGYRSITASVEVDVDDVLDEIDDDELVEEITRRGLMSSEYIHPEDMHKIITSIWLKRRSNKDYQRELDKLIYYSIGKII